MIAPGTLARGVSLRHNPSYSTPMELDKIFPLTDPAQVPANREEIPDDALINIDVWAALQGIEKASVNSIRTRSTRRRREGNPKPGDMPAEDQKIGATPFWMMSTYRGWEKNRPGKGAGAGRPPGTKNAPRTPRTLRLPAPCPHCHREIRGEDLPVEGQVSGTSFDELQQVAPASAPELEA